MRLRTIPLAVAALLVLSFFSAGRAQAAAVSTELPGSSVQSAAVAPSQAIALAKQAIVTSSVITHVPNDRLLMNHAVVTPVNDITVVTFPISEMTPGSNVSIALDPSGKVTQTGETHLREVSATSGYFTSWRDGQLLIDKLVDTERVNDDRATTASKGVKPFDIKKFNDCLSGAGIASWIVAGAGFACALPEPVSKILCIIGLGVGAGTAWACLRVAMT